MAHFRTGCKGGRGEVTRLGHKTNGCRAWINGWRSGASITASYDKETDRDVFAFSTNCGSGHSGGGPGYFAKFDGETLTIYNPHNKIKIVVDD